MYLFLPPSAVRWARLAALPLSLVLILSVISCGGNGSGEAATPGWPAATGATPLPSPGGPLPSPVLSGAPAVTEPATPTPSPAPPTAAPPTTAPASAAGLLTPVDKQRSLSGDYIPPDLTSVGVQWSASGFPDQWLRAEAAQALVEMLEAARVAGLEIRVLSAYRSYQQQVDTFRYWVAQLGETEARRVSAEPGHSEHQLGTAVDLSTASLGFDLSESFGQAPEGQWLAANSSHFGFALSYPQGAEAITGYSYEPWHFRYIGREYAARLASSGLTMGEFLRGLQAAGG